MAKMQNLVCANFRILLFFFGLKFLFFHTSCFEKLFRQNFDSEMMSSLMIQNLVFQLLKGQNLVCQQNLFSTKDFDW